MAKLYNLARMTTATTGTGTITLGSAVSGYLTFALAGVANGDSVDYAIADGANSEHGTGTYTSAGTTLTRTVTKSTNANAAINLSGTAEVFISPRAETLNDTSLLTTGTMATARLGSGTASSSTWLRGDSSWAALPVLVPQGRLTLQSANPVMSSTQSAKTTIYYTAYQGNQIPIYDGTNMVQTTITGGEISVATTDTTKNPAAIGASKVNDWFVWNDAGTIRLSHGPDWTNDTTRSAGTALVLTNGIYLNSVAITNGPAASRGTYVGTTRSNGSSQLDWIFGGSATAGFFGVWNAYNRVRIASTANESTGNWAYSSATVRGVNGTSNTRHSFVSGLAEETPDVTYSGRITVAAVVNAYYQAGVGYDSSSAHTKTSTFLNPVAGVSLQATVAMSFAPTAPPVGFHFFQATENSDGTNSSSAFGVTDQSFVFRFMM